MFASCFNVNFAGPPSAVGSASDAVRPHNFVSPFADSRRTVVSYLRKYGNEILVYRLGRLSLPRKSAMELTDRLDMTLAGRKTTQQQQIIVKNEHLHSSYIMCNKHKVFKKD